MPYQTATNPQTGDRVVLIDNQWQKVDQSATNPQSKVKAYLVGGKWLTDEPPAGPRKTPPAPGAPDSPVMKALHSAQDKKADFDEQARAKEKPLTPFTDLISEPIVHMASGVAGTVGGGLRGIGGSILGEENSGEQGQKWAEEHTYQPKSAMGQAVSKAIEYPGTKLAEGADVIGRNVAEETHSPALGAFANTATQAVAQALLGKGAGLAGEAAGIGGKAAVAGSRAQGAAAVRASAVAAPTLDLAKDFATTKLGTKWEDLPPGIQKKLKTAARDPAELQKLDAETVQREARAERLKMPISRGDAERNLGQQTREDNVKKVGNQNPLRDMRSDQDTALHGAVDEVRKSTGAIAKTDEQIGESVQNEGLRGKKAASKAAYDAQFAKARATEPNATVSADPLYEALAQNPDIQELGFLQSWLKKAQIEQKGTGPGAPVVLSTNIAKALEARAKGGVDETVERRPIPLTELQHLRETASDIARSAHGSEKHFAGKLVRAIDKSFDKIPAAAKEWKKARDLFKAHKEEFEEQGIIKSLGDNKRNSSDPRVDVENTVAKVLKSSKKDIGTLKKTLTTGGTQETRGAGVRAWRNVQAGVLDALKKKAEGRRGIKGEKGQAQFGSQFLDMFNQLEANGKIDAIFEPKQAAKLREIAKGVEDVRTKADKGISGTDTAANLKVENTLSMLEKAAKLGGTFASGGAKMLKSIHKGGRTRREFERAKTTPLTEAAETAKRTRAKTDKTRRRTPYTLKKLKRLGQTAPLTLQNQDQKQ